MIINQKKVYKKMNIYLILVFSLLVFKITPISYIGNQWSNVFIEIIIMISIFLLWLLNQKMKFFFDRISIHLMFLNLLFIVSGLRVFWGYFFDFKEFFNIIFYTSLYVTTRSIIKIYNIDKNDLIRNLGNVVIINSITSIFAYTNKSFFRVFSILFQTKKSSVINSAYQRFAGTFSNPNFFGIFYSIIAIYYLFIFLKINNSKKYGIVFLVCLILVNASGSRSAVLTTILIGLILSIIIVCEFRLNKPKLLKYSFFLFFVILFLFLVVHIDFTEFYESLNTRFFNIDNIKDNFNGRVHMVQMALVEFKKNLLFGVGTSIGSIDNQYAKVLMESGLIYFGLFIFFLINLLFLNLKNYFKSSELEKKNISFFLFLSEVSMIFNMFGAAIFSVTQLMALFIIILAINEA